MRTAGVRRDRTTFWRRGSGQFAALAAAALAIAALVLVAASSAQERVSHEAGEFESLGSSTGIVIAAPHGTFDANTAAMAIDIARRLGAGYVVFRGTSGGLRINVNRPTEGAGRACANEVQSDRAQAVYNTYARLVRIAGGGDRLSLYVEIHGNVASQSAQNIETASKGVTAAEAQAMKDGYPAILAAIRHDWPGYPALRLLVEPADRIFFTASCAKALGIFSTDLVPRALHFEFPRAAREPPLLDGTSTLTASLLKRFLQPR